MHMVRFCNNLGHVCSKSKIGKSNNLKSLGASKLKDLNSIIQINKCHLCLTEENLSFNIWIVRLSLRFLFCNIRYCPIKQLAILYVPSAHRKHKYMLLCTCYMKNHML